MNCLQTSTAYFTLWLPCRSETRELERRLRERDKEIEEKDTRVEVSVQVVIHQGQNYLSSLGDSTNMQLTP